MPTKYERPYVKRGKAMFCLLVICIAQAPCVFARQHNAGGLPAQLDQLMAAYTAAGLFNGSVLVAEGGRVLLEKGYGYSNLAAGTPNTAATRYPVYSVTKPMTAALIMQLADRGQLRLDNRLSRFYPGFPAADSITVMHLLTHTSGLYAYNNDHSMPTATEAAMLQFLAKRPLAFTPGSRWEYCNTGYYLLGFIIEKLTGRPYGEALASRLFLPLGMYESGIDFRALRSTAKATGYQLLYPDSGKAAVLYPQEELRSSGGVWSTVGDLLKFHNGMQAHRIISPAGTRQSYTAYRNRYGYGWFTDSADGQQIVSHSGGAAGFRSLLVRIPARNTCIVLLANAENIDLEVVKAGILQLLAGKKAPLPYSVPVDDARLSAIPGTYRLEPGRSLYVYRVKRRLAAQVSGQRPVLLLADSSGCFLVAGTDARLEFGGHQTGSGGTVKLYRKGRVHAGEKINAGWGITGDALAGGWSAPDVPLFPNAERPGLWTARNVALRDGVIKFRFNNDWTFNFGEGSTRGMLAEDGPDIRVNAGVYTVSLDLREPGKPVLLMREE